MISTHLSNQRSPFLEELRTVHQSLAGRDDWTVFQQLKKPSVVNTMIAFSWDWAWIGIAFCLTIRWGISSILPTLLILGSRQRALSNLVHDASHRNLLGDPKRNDRFADFLAACPMVDSVAAYRKSHMSHHRYLGSPELDPDSKSHLRYGFDDRSPSCGLAFPLYLRLIFNREAWRDSVLGNSLDLNRGELLLVCSWWLCVGLVTVTSFALETGIKFFALWWLARATTYHCIRIFCEFLDHTGLRVGSITGFTRNLPHTGLLAVFFHPHQDTYHLVHHLLPRVPHYHLEKAHRLLDRTAPLYRQAHFCDSYVRGRHPAFRCWMGRCEGVAK